MNTSAIENNYQIKIKPGRILVNRLQSRIKRCEKVHSMSSAQMLRVIRRDTSRETGEIGRWMQDYLVLKRIRNGASKNTR